MAGRDKPTDATRRTLLASERTYLAWWRSGMTAMAVSLGVGKVVPALATDRPRWPWMAAGVGFGVLGAAFVVHGLVRHRAVDRAIKKGGYAEPDDRVVSAFAVFGVALAVGVCVLIGLN
jgi:putative membrane protein